MNKIFTILLAVMLVVSLAGISDACSGNNCPPVAVGSLDVDAHAFGAGFDADGRLIPNGGAFGLGGASGSAGAHANGFIVDGDVAGDVTAIGGGLTDTDAYIFFPSVGDLAIGVGSSSFSQAVTGGSVSVGVDPDQGFGAAHGSMSGRAHQSTLNMSGVGESPFFFNSTGHTGGVAGQGSTGSFNGAVSAASGADYDYWVWHGGWWWGHYHHYYADSNANASIDAFLEMWGGSYSESYRFVDFDGDSRTEGMGTNVGAFTEVRSEASASHYANGNAYASARVNGCFTAAGAVSTTTVQNAPGFGGAMASASGSYAGGGSLGTSFSGSATGYSATSVTTVSGMSGSINSAAAGMNVSATIN